LEFNLSKGALVMIIANIDPVTAFNFQFIAVIIVLLCTLFNLYYFFKGHRHNAKDIDITILDRSYSSGRNFNADRPLNVLWIILLKQLKISIEVNPLPKEDLLITNNSKPTDNITEGILNTVKNMPYSKVQELLAEIEKLPKNDKATDGVA
jgi:hypothetical protein